MSYYRQLIESSNGVNFISFEKKFLHPAYLAFILYLTIFVVVKYLIRDVPLNNVLQNVRYGRNSVKIFLAPETVKMTGMSVCLNEEDYQVFGIRICFCRSIQTVHEIKK